MRVHYLQHVAFEGLGAIGPWLAERNLAVTGTRFDVSAELPDLGAIDWLVVMGGPMSVNDGQRYGWLAAEKAYIRAAIESGKRVLGVCLGAQLIASALGAPVYPNAVKEIGWLPIDAVPDAPEACGFAFPERTLAFHWHGETFDLPPGAMHLARSATCAHQAFQVGRRVLGLQFHLETTPESVRALVAHCADDLAPGPCVQPAQTLLSAPDGNYRAANALLRDVLAYLADA